MVHFSLNFDKSLVTQQKPGYLKRLKEFPCLLESQKERGMHSVTIEYSPLLFSNLEIRYSLAEMLGWTGLAQDRIQFVHCEKFVFIVFILYKPGSSLVPTLDKTLITQAL